MEFDIAFKIKAKHGKLQKFIDDMGWTQADFARHIGYCPGKVGRWFNLKDYPRSKKLLDLVCTLLCESAEDLFPEFLKNPKFLSQHKLATIHKKIDIVYLDKIPEMGYLPEYLNDDYGSTLKDKTEEVLKTLKFREGKILKKRFGLADFEKAPLTEVGEDFDISATRISQIEKKALRKLRHPSRIKQLIEFI
jgi:transcriptional regulator with XRE-family HTH domain